MITYLRDMSKKLDETNIEITRLRTTLGEVVSAMHSGVDSLSKFTDQLDNLVETREEKINANTRTKKGRKKS